MKSKLFAVLFLLFATVAGAGQMPPNFLGWPAGGCLGGTYPNPNSLTPSCVPAFQLPYGQPTNLLQLSLPSGVLLRNTTFVDSASLANGGSVTLVTPQNVVNGDFLVFYLVVSVPTTGSDVAGGVVTNVAIPSGLTHRLFPYNQSGASSAGCPSACQINTGPNTAGVDEVWTDALSSSPAPTYTFTITAASGTPAFNVKAIMLAYYPAKAGSTISIDGTTKGCQNSETSTGTTWYSSFLGEICQNGSLVTAQAAESVLYCGISNAFSGHSTNFFDTPWAAPWTQAIADTNALGGTKTPHVVCGQLVVPNASTTLANPFLTLYYTTSGSYNWEFTGFLMGLKLSTSDTASQWLAANVPAIPLSQQTCIGNTTVTLSTASYTAVDAVSLAPLVGNSLRVAWQYAIEVNVALATCQTICAIKDPDNGPAYFLGSETYSTLGSTGLLTLSASGVTPYFPVQPNTHNFTLQCEDVGTCGTDNIVNGNQAMGQRGSCLSMQTMLSN